MVEFWTGALALTVFLYVLLDGFDLGVGILFGFTRDQSLRSQMLQSISPVWDGNETWLVISAAILFGAFPAVYALLLGAFYLPLILMLCGLILRGVAFEFRANSTRTRGLWDLGFWLGSITAAFVQGCAVGALVMGLPNVGGNFTGGPFFWAQPFPLLCGFGLCIGYALIGGAWLVRKTEGRLRERSYRQTIRLLGAVLAFLVAVFLFALSLDLRILDRWIERPALGIFPLIGLAAVGIMVRGFTERRDLLPLIGGILLFISAFGTLAASFLPYMIPFTITYTQAAAPHSSLAFLFWFAGIVVLPLTLIHAAVNYAVFHGKVRPEEAEY
jgi:cytochrome d ubiquinol oxidase subunit II